MMTGSRVSTTKVRASAARTQWGSLLNRILHARERIVIERNGAPIAAIVPIEDYAWLQRMDAKREHDFAAINGIGRAFADVPLDELQREVDKATAEVKQEFLAKRRAQQSAQSPLPTPKIARVGP